MCNLHAVHPPQYLIPTLAMFKLILTLQAHQRGMTFPRYTFISHYWWSEFWWTDQTDSFCSVQQLTEAIFMSLAVDHFPTPSDEEMRAPTDVGYVSRYN